MLCVEYYSQGGVDYLPPTTPTISFASGAKSVDSPLCTSFQLLQDTVVEYNDNFTIYLTSSFPTSQVQISPTTGSLTFTIIEDDDSKYIISKDSNLNKSFDKGLFFFYFSNSGLI